MKSLAPQVIVLAAYRDGTTVQIGPSCSIGQGLYRTLYNLRDDAACFPPSLIVSYRIVYADNGAVLGGRYDPAVYTRHTCLDCLEDKAAFFSSPTGRAILGILGAVDALRTSALYLRLRIARRMTPPVKQALVYLALAVPWSFAGGGAVWLCGATHHLNAARIGIGVLFAGVLACAALARRIAPLAVPGVTGDLREEVW